MKRWFKRKQAPPYDHVQRIRWHLGSGEVSAAFAVAKTLTRFCFDKYEKIFELESDCISGGFGRLHGVVHEHFDELTYIRITAEFVDRAPDASEESVGRLMLIKNQQKGLLGSHSHRYQATLNIDHEFEMSVKINDHGRKIFSSIQQSMRDAVASKLRFCHVSLQLQCPDVDSVMDEFLKTGRAEIAIKSIGWADEVTLPEAPRWSWLWSLEDWER